MDPDIKRELDQLEDIMALIRTKTEEDMFSSDEDNTAINEKIIPATFKATGQDIDTKKFFRDLVATGGKLTAYLEQDADPDMNAIGEGMNENLRGHIADHIEWKAKFKIFKQYGHKEQYLALSKESKGDAAAGKQVEVKDNGKNDAKDGSKEINKARLSKDTDQVKPYLQGMFIYVNLNKRWKSLTIGSSTLSHHRIPPQAKLLPADHPATSTTMLPHNWSMELEILGRKGNEEQKWARS